MSSLAVLPQPIQGVIGSGARRSPTGLQNPQKLVCINGNGSMESGNSSRSSTSGEDGFVSGSSSAEEISYADQLCGPLGALAIGKPSLNSFSGGAFSADAALQKAFASPNNNLLLEQSKLRGINDHMKEAPLFAAPYQSTFASQPNSFQPCANGPTRPLQLPGAWFYENSLDEGLPGSGSASTGVPGECSPIAELNDEYQYAAFRDALNNPYTVDEHVEVPSSEHVAEIVGRQGCKIKALRAKTNTYIKTPSRNEPPVFRITGRPEDVGEAKHEIECAAEHFTQIRASRRHSQGGMPAPGHVTAYVRVPLRVVGLVVGPKGGTIKRIQQDTHTYIITPSREREPIFEVTGLPENVASARREIEQHIYQRTGNMPITDPNASIQDYDLMAAHAAVIAQVNNGPNRPNYGALAVRRTSGAESGIMELQRNPDLMNAMMRHGLVSKPYSSMSPPLGSVNNIFPLNTYQNSHDMVSNPNSMSSTTAFTRSSNSYQPTSNYQTWTSGFSSLGTQSNGASNFVQDVFSQPHGMHSNGFDSLYNNALYHANSKFSSRDEGLGDSPTTSCGKLNTEPFHLMSSIWSDLEANNTCEQKPSGIPLATA